MSILLRGSTYYLRKRVPRRYGEVEARDFILLSLHTDSRTAAEAKAQKIWADMIDAWEATLDGEKAEADDKMAAARELAAKKGFRFMSARGVAKLDIPEIMERVEAAGRGRDRTIKPVAAKAVLGWPCPLGHPSIAAFGADAQPEAKAQLAPIPGRRGRIPPAMLVADP